MQGRVFASAKAAAYQHMKRDLLPYVLESYQRLRGEADIVLVEGAGSAAEVNLRKNDIANMGFARAAEVPVVLIGDIDRGGVIASLVGTKAVLAPDDAALIRGFIVNKFRGDAALFAAGMEQIAQATGWAALGLVPYFADARLLPAEDALALEQRARPKPNARVRIAVPILPHIANFDDLDPLDAEGDVELMRVRPGAALPGDADLVVLPGSKATIADLAALRAAGFDIDIAAHKRRGGMISACGGYQMLDIDIAAHRRRGGMILGLCGGYQMLGRTIADPDGVEGPSATVEGLGLLDVATTLVGRQAPRSRARHVERRRTVCRLRDAYGRNDWAGLRAAIRAARRWRARRRRFAGRPGDRHLCAWAVRRRPAARGVVGAFRRHSKRRVRRSGRAHARCACRASRRAFGSRSLAYTGAMSSAVTTPSSAIRIASAIR